MKTKLLAAVGTILVTFVTCMISIVIWNTLFATRRARMLSQVCFELRVGTNQFRGSIPPDHYSCQIETLPPVPKWTSRRRSSNSIVQLIDQVNVKFPGLPTQNLSLSGTGFFPLDIPDSGYNEVEIRIISRTNGYITFSRGI